MNVIMYVMMYEDDGDVWLIVYGSGVPIGGKFEGRNLIVG